MYLCALKTIGMTGQKTPTALGTEKIGKLLMQYAIPAIIAMTASSLYNMVDSIFIGHGVGAFAFVAHGSQMVLIVLIGIYAFISMACDKKKQIGRAHV